MWVKEGRIKLTNCRVKKIKKSNRMKNSLKNDVKIDEKCDEVYKKVEIL